MKIYIKHMVCSRCKMVVQGELEKAGLTPLSVSLGEVDVKEELSPEALRALDQALRSFGFEVIADQKGRIIEKIKNAIVELVHYGAEGADLRLSEFLSSRLHYEYSYLSGLFSEVQEMTIEKYLIAQRIERAKELLSYGELTLSAIALQLGYSSPAYLSSQFKKHTGLSPSAYKVLGENRRKNLEEV